MQSMLGLKSMEIGPGDIASKLDTSKIERLINSDPDENSNCLLNEFGMKSQFTMGEEDGQIYEVFEPVRQ